MGQTSSYLEEKLRERFSPISLEIINESHLHAGHHGHDGSGETHLRIKIVAEVFAQMSRLERHRAVLAIAQPAIDDGLHACAIEATPPSQ